MNDLRTMTDADLITLANARFGAKDYATQARGTAARCELLRREDITDNCPVVRMARREAAKARRAEQKRQRALRSLFNANKPVDPNAPKLDLFALLGL